MNRRIFSSRSKVKVLIANLQVHVMQTQQSFRNLPQQEFRGIAFNYAMYLYYHCTGFISCDD